MANIQLDLPAGSLNKSLQTGDTVFKLNLNTVGSKTEGESILTLGTVVRIDYRTGSDQIVVEVVDDNIDLPRRDDYIMFAKSSNVNNTSIPGYYAEVKMVNNAYEKIELFSVSVEASISSK